MNRTVVVIGLVIFAALVGVLYFALGKDPQAIDSPLIGKTAPPFALKQAGTASTLDLTQFRGKPVVINFWATWCVPCYQEHPVLTQAARAYGSQVQFLGVVFDDAEGKILDFLKQNGGAYPTLMDQGGKTSIAYGVGGVPETFFLDRNGRIVAKYVGPLTPALMREYVASASR